MLHAANGAHIILARASRCRDHDQRQQGPRAAVDPTPQPLPRPAQTSRAGRASRVVYLAACVSRAMGPAARDQEQEPLLDKTRSLLEKAGYR